MGGDPCDPRISHSRQLAAAFPTAMPLPCHHPLRSDVVDTDYIICITFIVGKIHLM
jgi:hypothetical protein